MPATAPNARTSSPGWITAQAGPRPGLSSKVSKPLRFTVSELAYVMSLCVVATLFLRPTDLIESLQGLPIYECLILGSFGLCLPGLAKHLTPRALKQEPVNICMLGLFVGIIMSHVASMYLFGMWDAFATFGKVMIFYAVLMTVTTTVPRLRGMLMCFALIGTLMVTLCVLDYTNIHDFKFITHLIDRGDDNDATGKINRIIRMRGTGLFQDPNDLAMVIVACGILCLCFMNDRSFGFARFMWGGPILILLTGLALTRSRGGLLAAGVATLALVATRLGKKWAIIIAILGAMSLPVVAGRQANIGVGSGTSHERVLMWREGYNEITNHRVLMGIGYNTYHDIAGLVAHNSYIHTYVELGFLGGSCFFGLWFFIMLAMARYGSSGLPLKDKNLEHIGPYLGAATVGWMASMFSLSRCYVPPTYFFVGMGTAYINLVCLNLPKPQLLIRGDRKHFRLMLFWSAGLFVFLWIFVKVIA